MRCRLVVINPAHCGADIPVAVIEEDGGLLVRGDDWMFRLPVERLEDVTVTDVRAALSLPASVPVLLSGESRPVPETEWLALETLDWADAWKREIKAQKTIAPTPKNEWNKPKKKISAA